MAGVMITDQYDQTHQHSKWQNNRVAQSDWKITETNLVPKICTKNANITTYSNMLENMILY